MEATKRCSKCGEVKALTEFGKCNRTKDGHNTRCKACCNAMQRAQREQNPEKARAREQRYRQAHPGRVQEAVRRFRIAHPEKKREHNHRYQEKHPDRVREAKRRYAEDHPDRMNSATRRYREANPEKQREYDRQRYSANPKRERERARQYQRQHPEVKRRSEQHRRARKRNALGSYTSQDLDKQLLEQRSLCFWCSEPLESGWQVDHVIPISRNGSNWPENIVCACPSCNLRKQDKIPFIEWNPRAALIQADEIPVLVKWIEENNKF
jgi:5-methylcytosine-specific restriction endonuclease McrA